MTTEELISHIRVIPDYPIKGIMFQDVTTLFMNPGCLKEISDRIYEMYKDKGITKAVSNLVGKFNPVKQYMNCIIDLTDCPRRDVFPKDIEFTSVIAIKEH